MQCIHAFVRISVSEEIFCLHEHDIDCYPSSMHSVWEGYCSRRVS